MARYVIAGAAGRVGSAVIRELLTRGEEVEGVVRPAGRAEPAPIHAARCDLADRHRLATHLRGAAGFLALLPEDRAAADFHGTRRVLTESIAAAVAASGVPHVVMISSLGAGEAGGHGPVRGLHALEEALRGTGARVSALRSCMFQDYVAGVFPAAQNGIYPSLLPADHALPMIAIRDVGRFAADALQAPPAASEVVDLVGPSYTPRQLATLLGTALGTELRLVEVPAAGHVDALMQAGLPRTMAEAIAELHAALAAGAIRPRAERRRVGTTTMEQTLQRLLYGQVSGQH